jgi:hypothetical protein
MRRPFHTQLLVGPPSSKWPVPVAVDIRLADSNGSPLPQALPEHWEAALQRIRSVVVPMQMFALWHQAVTDTSLHRKPRLAPRRPSNSLHQPTDRRSESGQKGAAALMPLAFLPEYHFDRQL